MEHSILDSMKMRRSVYQLGKTLPFSIDELEQLVKDAVKYTPSAFNSQTSRAIVLYGEENDWLWQSIFEKVRPLLADGQEASTKAKLASFNAGVGTILFFEELAIVSQLEKDFPLYSENFGQWSQHASGMTQLAVWTVLAEHHIGASLQHYGNLIEKEVQRRYELPTSWSLIAMMPFGSIEGQPPAKQFGDINSRVLIKD